MHRKRYIDSNDSSNGYGDNKKFKKANMFSVPHDHHHRSSSHRHQSRDRSDPRNRSLYERPSSFSSRSSNYQQRGSFSHHRSQSSLAESLESSLSLTEVAERYSIRRSYNNLEPIGTEKQQTDLTGNYFKLSVEKSLVYQYEVNMSQNYEFEIPSQPKRENVSCKVKPNAPKPQLSPKELEVGKIGDPIKTMDFVETIPLLDDKLAGDDAIDVRKIKASKNFLSKNSSQIMKHFWKLNSKLFGLLSFVYDGHSCLYVTKKLDLESPEYVDEFEYRIEPGSFTEFYKVIPKTKIELRFVSVIDLGKIEDFFQRKLTVLPVQVITLLDIVFHNVLAQHFHCQQKKYFDLENEKAISYDQKAGYLEFVSGFEFSIRKAQIGLSLIISPKKACLFNTRRSNRLIDLIKEIEPKFLDKFDFYKINNIIKTLKIYTEHGYKRRTYIVHSLVNEIPKTKKFVLTDGKSTTVYDYFINKYSDKIPKGINPNLPLIKTTRDDFLPLDVCLVEKNQFLDNMNMDSEVRSIFLNKSKFEPQSFFKYIQTYVDYLVRLDSPILKEYGIKIHPKPARFNGYKLEQPTFFKNPFQITEPAEKLKWALISFDDQISDSNLGNFCVDIEQKFDDNKLDIGKNRLMKTFRLRSEKHLAEDIKSAFNEMNKYKIKFCFVAIPEFHEYIKNSSEIYGLCSSIATQTFGIRIQCLKGRNVLKPPRGYFDNLLFEVNGKLGGQNSVINPKFWEEQLPNIDFSKTMVIGADVNHPGVKEKFKVSISAASGTYDKELTKYANSIRVQKRECNKDSKEMISKFDEMVTELLESYKKHNDDRLPKNLIIFRDGVSENQFDMVRKKEIPLIRKTMKKFSQSMTLTVIIVQKRHQTRFVTTEPYPHSRKMTQNVPSGTVVDNSIVEPDFDLFYLNPHYSQLGTSRPTKYIVIRNDLKLTNKDLHKLCFLICFNCVRRQNPISLPTPVMYADLCAYKSKIHIMANAQKYNYEPKQDDKDDDEQVRRYQEWVNIEDQDSKDSFFYL